MFRTNKNSSLFSSVMPELTKKDELHDWLKLQWDRDGIEQGEWRPKSPLFGVTEAAILPRIMQDGPQYFYSDMPDLDFRGKQKRTMHSLTRNIQQFCIINQLFETKKNLAIILSCYSSNHTGAVKLTFWSSMVAEGGGADGQGQTCWEPTTFRFCSRRPLLFRTCCHPDNTSLFWEVSLAFVISSTSQ